MKQVIVVTGASSGVGSLAARALALSNSVLAKSFPTYGPYIAAKAGVNGRGSREARPRRSSRNLESFLRSNPWAGRRI